jgi:hypothetical protein
VRGCVRLPQGVTHTPSGADPLVRAGPPEDEAIAALLTQRNIEDAAKAVGIAPNTLLNWMKDVHPLYLLNKPGRSGMAPAEPRLRSANVAYFLPQIVPLGHSILINHDTICVLRPSDY